MTKVSLEDFVYETLMSISSAVARAQEDSKKAGTIPIALSAVGQKEVQHGEQLVSFSIGVETSKAKAGSVEGEAKGSFISVVSGSVRANGRAENKANDTHKIEFSVPVYFNSRWPKA